MAAKSGGSAGLPCMAIAYSARAVCAAALASASTPQHAMAAARRRDRISIEGRAEARDNEPNLCGREELAAAANLTQRGVYAGFIAPRNCAIWRRGGVTLLPQSASIDPLAGVKAAGVKARHARRRIEGIAPLRTSHHRRTGQNRPSRFADGSTYRRTVS